MAQPFQQAHPIDAGPGTPDGMRCDIDGNLWCGWGMGDPELDGVVVFAPTASDRPHRAARALRQCVLRRAEAQPAVHGVEPVDLRAVCEHARRAGGLKRPVPLYRRDVRLHAEPQRFRSTISPSLMSSTAPQNLRAAGCHCCPTPAIPPLLLPASRCAEANSPMPPPRKCGQYVASTPALARDRETAADAAPFGDVGLHHGQHAFSERRREILAARDVFAAGQRHREALGQARHSLHGRSARSGSSSHARSNSSSGGANCSACSIHHP